VPIVLSQKDYFIRAQIPVIYSIEEKDITFAGILYCQSSEENRKYFKNEFAIVLQ
jgi:hypothetical protein